MIDIVNIISQEFNIAKWQVENSLELHGEGGTIPFIARYRKEKTGELDENQLRDIFEREEYLKELEARKETILKTIDEQGKLTDELRQKIEKTLLKTELEDLYLPYKPKRRTRGTIAVEKGLKPFAEEIKQANVISSPDINFEDIGSKYIDAEKGVETWADALQGAKDIIAEEIAETADYRAWLREYLLRDGIFKSKVKDEYEEGSTKYEMYRDFSVGVRDIKPHTMLALRRGEAEKILTLDLTYEEEDILGYLGQKEIFTSNEELIEVYEKIIKDSFTRLMKHSIIGEVRLEKKKASDEESIRVFESNLRQLLLSSPAGMKPTIGIDPGFRTGCKVAVVDGTGKFVENTVIYPLEKNRAEQSKSTLKRLIKDYNIELISVGNGTAGRESNDFVAEMLDELDSKPVNVMVSESGASVYSASKVANEEFPDLDLTVRGAISIARRLQDPLAELVKIDPKSIGVGQYQHDVDQKLLKKKLAETVESCVNYVGVDLNLASKELLTYVSGISQSVARNIVEWRNTNGAFRSRKDLLSVPMFGKKAFEQAAGFLRIRGGENILDNTAVHPESYDVVKMIAGDMRMNLEEIERLGDSLDGVDLAKYVSESIGLPSLKDIVAEIRKPGRDPRQKFKYAKFDRNIKEVKDLAIGMDLEGVVTNITNFGAFVDVGVHQDGLVHISEIANRYINHPSDELEVGQICRVKVIDVNLKLNRIGLSIKQARQ